MMSVILFGALAVIPFFYRSPILASGSFGLCVENRTVLFSAIIGRLLWSPVDEGWLLSRDPNEILCVRACVCVFRCTKSYPCLFHFLIFCFFVKCIVLLLRLYLNEPPLRLFTLLFRFVPGKFPFQEFVAASSERCPVFRALFILG